MGRRPIDCADAETGTSSRPGIANHSHLSGDAPYLDAARDAAEPGAVYLLPRLRTHSGNVGTMLRKYILRAGLQPWPRLMQNLRASRATELADQFPGDVASAWLGHTEEIANRHYRSVLDSHFATANELPTQYDAERGGKKRTDVQIGNAKTSGNPAFPDVSRSRTVGATGLEPVTPTMSM